MKRGVYCTGAVLAAFVAFAPDAEANSAAPFSRPTGGVAGLVVERPSPVVVEREDLEIDCSKDEATVHPDCTFRATYALVNPTAQEEELVGGFFTAWRKSTYGHHEDEKRSLQITLDGRDVRATTTPEQSARMQQIVRSDPGTAALLDEHALALEHGDFRIVVAPGAHARLVFEGTLQPYAFGGGNLREGYVVPPLVQRHVLLGPTGHYDYAKSEDDFVYLVTPITQWAGDPAIHVTIKHHNANDFASATPTTRERSGGIVTERAVLRGSGRRDVRFRLSYAPSFVLHGGPMVGIGPRIGREELLLRFGYEVGLSSSFLLAATADTNFEKYVTTALTLEAATPSFIFIIPSLAFGLGVPVQFRENTDPRVGVRTQFSIALPLVRFTFPIDVYPKENSSGSHVEGSFVTALSF